MLYLHLIFPKCFWNRKFLLKISAWKKSLGLKGGYYIKHIQ